MRKRMLAVLALATVLCLAGAPQQADAHVSFSIGIPIPGVYVGPAYPPAYYPPAPVYYGPPAYYGYGAPAYYGYGPGYGGGVVVGTRFAGPRFYGPRHFGPRWGGGRHWVGQPWHR
jgi:hypothetical protein